jgi:hypothetical protein
VTHAVVQLDLPVVRLDLRREHVEVDAEALDERAGQLGPVDVGGGGQMRRPGAGGAGELRQVLAAGDLRGHALEAPGEDGELLAHRRRGRGLAVRAREHRGIPVLVGERRQRVDHGAQLRQPDVLDGALDRQRVRRVDVLARAREVGELGDGVEAEVCRRSRTRYSTAFTSWRVTDSVEASHSISAAPNAVELAEASFWSAVSAVEPNRPRSVSVMIHSTSTSTRARLRPASDRYADRSATAPR